jgi:hypothetical protein
MATETVLIHDGSQTTAAANYGNGQSLSGNQGSAQFLACFLSASRVVTLVATQGIEIYGVIQNKPALGAAVDVGVLGVTKMVAGGTIAFGAKLMVDSSGRFITWTSGSANVQVGVAIEAAVISQVFTGYTFGPGGPLTLT